MFTVPLPRIGTDKAWREAARSLLTNRVPPEDVLWDFDQTLPELFSVPRPLPELRGQPKVPKSFVELSQQVVWHKDPQRFARLYALLWKIRLDPALMSDRADADLAKLQQMEKAVRRCKHKMKAFVRFRDLRNGGPRRGFAAWFEPTHHTVEPTAPFFARRFADMDWIILTPDVTARFEDGTLTFQAGQEKPDLPEDATEELWGTYFRNIFNPARLKVRAMTSEMPKKYWKNLPEAKHIPDLIAHAEAKARDMQDRAPTLPPERVARIREQLVETAQPASWNMLEAGLRGCDRCPLCQPATQVVPGVGPRDRTADDRRRTARRPRGSGGRSLVGPAGRLFDQLAKEAGLDRESAFVTNAVKHFKFQQRGKRRIHQNPGSAEIEQCRFWMKSEVALVKPKLILGMGGTAAECLTGSRKDILKRRGSVEQTDFGPVFLTVHPSYLLRLPDQLRADANAAFVADLQKVRRAMS